MALHGLRRRVERFAAEDDAAVSGPRLALIPATDSVTFLPAGALPYDGVRNCTIEPSVLTMFR